MSTTINLARHPDKRRSPSIVFITLRSVAPPIPGTARLALTAYLCVSHLLLRDVARSVPGRTRGHGLNRFLPSCLCSPFIIAICPDGQQACHLAQATNRRVADIIGPSDIRKHLSCLPTC